MRKREAKRQQENAQKDSCRFYSGGGRCGLTKEYQLICGKKRCTLYKPRETEVDNAEILSTKERESVHT